MLKSSKHVFWEALIITLVVFLIGLFLGMMIETGNSNKISSFYLSSEINLVDALTLSQMTEDLVNGCDFAGRESINLANRVYEEALLLEDYEERGILTDNLKLLHKKYDLLRTLIWIGNQKSLDKCKNYDLVVYLYEYDTEDSDKLASQDVWSKVLLDFRNDRETVLLLPIAADQDLSSLGLLMEEYGVESLPAIVVNNKHVLYELEEIVNLEDYLG